MLDPRVRKLLEEIIALANDEDGGREVALRAVDWAEEAEAILKEDGEKTP